MYKPHDIIILDTYKSSIIVKNTMSIHIQSESKLYLRQEPESINPKSKSTVNQHLYILSDDEIHAHDWYIWLNNNQICQAEGMIMTLNNHIKNGHIKKIIATTDTELRDKITKPQFHEFGNSITQIPTSFIKYFIEQYNKRNIITKVNVEYGYTINKSMGHFHQYREYFLKINSDNTINIKTTKDGYTHTLKELSNILTKYAAYINNDADIDESEILTVDKWLEQNL